MPDKVLLGLKITGALLECAGAAVDLYEKVKARRVSSQQPQKMPEYEHTRC